MNCVFQKHMLKSYPLVPVNESLLEIGSCRCNQVKKDHLVGCNPICPDKRADAHMKTDTQGNSLTITETEIGVTSQRPIDTTRNQKRQGGIRPYRFQREHSPAGTSILDFQPADQWDNKFLFFQRHPVCGTLLWQPQETSTELEVLSRERKL